MTSISRRNLLKSGAALGATSILVGCSKSGQVVIQNGNPTEVNNDQLWIQVSSNDDIQITIPSAEMGQGVYTACAMLVAEELGCDWQNIKVKPAPWNKGYRNPIFRMQMTGGSTTIPGYWEPMRKVGATARELFLQAAATEFATDKENLRVENGRIFAANGESRSFGELIKTAVSLDEPEDVALKPLEQHKLIGTSAPRVDTPIKTNGTAEFGIDVNFDGLKVATIAQSPVFSGELATYNKAAAMAVKGVEDVVLLNGAVAVVADTYWHAKKGLAALEPTFKGGDNEINSEKISEILTAQLDEKPIKDLKDSATVFDFEYEVPFLAHATLEPMNCTVQLSETQCDIWVPSQSQELTGRIAEDLTGLDQENIHVHLTYLGGGFGRRGENDFVGQTIQIAQATGKPIKLIWSREEDTQHDFYRPVAKTRYKIGLDESNNIKEWHNHLASPSIFERIFKSFAPGFLSWVPFTRIIDDPVAVEGMKEVPYIEEPEFKYLQSKLPIPVGFWRSVGNSYSAYFTESAIDEIATATGSDPFEYRLSQMTDPRAIAVTKAAADAAKWGRSDVHQGIAYHKSFGSYVAEVVDLTVDENKVVSIHKITIAVDSGIVVNPDTVKAQMEGGMIYGLVAAAVGEINIEEGRVKESNFNDYPMLRLYQTPIVDVILVPSGDAPGGVGEPGTPPIAAALTNAIFAATGERIRQLPISKAGYSIGKTTI